jgi:hypothetical protein
MLIQDYTCTLLSYGVHEGDTLQIQIRHCSRRLLVLSEPRYMMSGEDGEPCSYKSALSIFLRPYAYYRGKYAWDGNMNVGSLPNCPDFG